MRALFAARLAEIPENHCSASAPLLPEICRHQGAGCQSSANRVQQHRQAMTRQTFEMALQGDRLDKDADTFAPCGPKLSNRSQQPRLTDAMPAERLVCRADTY